jgi:hypothetical protein
LKSFKDHMFEHCVNEVANQMYPTSPTLRDRMVIDFKLLTQSMKTTVPLLIMSVLGWSFSLISVTLEGILVYYFYRQLIVLYTSIRTHNAADPESAIQPEQELYRILKSMVAECIAQLHDK